MDRVPSIDELRCIRDAAIEWGEKLRVYTRLVEGKSIDSELVGVATDTAPWELLELLNRSSVPFEKWIGFNQVQGEGSDVIEMKGWSRTVFDAVAWLVSAVRKFLTLMQWEPLCECKSIAFEYSPKDVGPRRKPREGSFAVFANTKTFVWPEVPCEITDLLDEAITAIQRELPESNANDPLADLKFPLNADDWKSLSQEQCDLFSDDVSPSDLAKRFGCSWEALKPRVANGEVRAAIFTSRRYRIVTSDLPK